MVLLALLLTSGSGLADSRTNTVSGHGTWRLGPLTINLDQGTLSQQSDHGFLGDTDCVCHHTDFFGFCNGWIAQGTEYVDRWGESFSGAGSSLNLPAYAARAMWSVFAHADGSVGTLALCQSQLQAQRAASEASASVEHNRFASTSGQASVRTRVSIAVPLTGFSVGVPLLDVCSTGTASWSGTFSSASFQFSGPARLCLGNVALPLTLTGEGSGPT